MRIPSACVDLVSSLQSAVADASVSSPQQGVPKGSIPRRHLAKGVYFTLQGCAYPPKPPTTLGVLITLRSASLTRRNQCVLANPHPRHTRSKSPFSRLVYPMPEDGGLGTHATLDLAGSCRFGCGWNRAVDLALPIWCCAAQRQSSASGFVTCFPGSGLSNVPHSPDVEWVSEISYGVDPARMARPVQSEFRNPCVRM